MSQVFHTKVAEGGRVVIPAAIREKLGLKSGAEVIFSVDEEGARLRPLDRAIEQAQNYFASLAPADVVMSEELIRERRLEAKKDEDA